MRFSKYIGPIRDPVQRFFAEDLELGYLMTKMIGIASAVVLLFIFGFVMRYGGVWAILLWIALCSALAIRLVVRYWAPVFAQKIMNAGKRFTNYALDEHRYDEDHSDKWPFLCSNCRHPKLWYDKLAVSGVGPAHKPICNKCGTTDAVKVFALWRQDPGIEAGLEPHIDPMIAAALREKEDQENQNKLSAPQ